MYRVPRFEIVERTDKWVLLRDLGPWDQYPTITNAVESVVSFMADSLNGRRLEYIDSEGNRDQILVENGLFVGFAPAGPSGSSDAIIVG